MAVAKLKGCNLWGNQHIPWRLNKKHVGYSRQARHVGNETHPVSILKLTCFTGRRQTTSKKTSHLTRKKSIEGNQLDCADGVMYASRTKVSTKLVGGALNHTHGKQSSARQGSIYN